MGDTNTYAVTLTKVVRYTETVDVVHTSPEEAVKVAREQFPDYAPDDVTWKTSSDDKPESTEHCHGVIGSCESCNRALLQGYSQYVYENIDGIYLCQECADESKLRVNASESGPITVEIEMQFVAVPFTAVSLNGLYIRDLNTFKRPYSGGWALISNKYGRAVDDALGRPYHYRSLVSAVKDARRLIALGDHSVCR